jgi:hypothetical protein
MDHDYELAVTNAADLRVALLEDSPAAAPKRRSAPTEAQGGEASDG